MSCMIISLEALARVRETLTASAYYKGDDINRPSRLYRAFANGSTAAAKRLADEFVKLACIYNNIEYFKGEQARNNAEPVEWGIELYHLQNMVNRQPLDVYQLYKTLEMIDYNTDPQGWMEPEEYDNWCRREEFEKFKETLKNLSLFLAEHIAKNTEGYKNAQWSIE